MSREMKMEFKSCQLNSCCIKHLFIVENIIISIKISVKEYCHYYCSVTKLCLTLCNLMDCSTPGSSVLHYLLEFLKFMSIELVMPSNHFILCYPFSFSLQSFPAARSVPMSWLFSSGGQSIAASALSTVFPMNIHG